MNGPDSTPAHRGKVLLACEGRGLHSVQVALVLARKKDIEAGHALDATCTHSGSHRRRTSVSQSVMLPTLTILKMVVV